MTTTLEKPLTTYYVTKYWESRGILEARGYEDGPQEGLRRMVHIPTRRNGMRLFFGDDYWPTLEEARAHVRKALLKRVSTLQKKILRLQERLTGVNHEDATPYEEI